MCPLVMMILSKDAVFKYYAMITGFFFFESVLKDTGCRPATARLIEPTRHRLLNLAVGVLQVKRHGNQIVVLINLYGEM